MRFKCKIWITAEESEEAVIGKGRAALLRAIKEHNSLKKAADELNMSYRAAWGKIRKAERRLGYKLIQTQTGGIGGGETSLTSEGLELLEKYDLFVEKVSEFANNLFDKVEF
ncbi:MAG: LysR family transcriptional regulator [Firmicutes bacterium]|nr:LysR family transcriptional regulator [Bacillota bacterium]